MSTKQVEKTAVMEHEEPEAPEGSQPEAAGPLVEALLQLFERAGYRDEPLLEAVDSLEQGRYGVELLTLRGENERLRRQIIQLRKSANRGLDSMSSKLREALRE